MFHVAAIICVVFYVLHGFLVFLLDARQMLPCFLLLHIASLFSLLFSVGCLSDVAVLIYIYIYTHIMYIYNVCCISCVSLFPNVLFPLDVYMLPLYNIKRIIEIDNDTKQQESMSRIKFETTIIESLNLTKTTETK